MKKKTKLLAVVLCLAMFAAMALGSGSSESGETKDIVTTNPNKEMTDSQEHGSETNTAQETSEETTKQDAANITIEEQVLLNQNGITITATEYITDSIWGDGIQLLIENNSDQTVTIGCNALIVNHYMITDLFVSEVSPGKKANDIIYLSNAELSAAGIERVGQVEIYFHVYDSTTYDTIFDSDCVTIQTSGFADMDTTPDDIGTELYNANGVRIVGKTVDENSFWGTAILLYCENTSGRNVGISVEEMSINGYMMSPFFSATVYNGKMALDEISILSTDLESNGIDTIEEVELKFHIYDADSYDTIADSEPITFSAQ